MAPLYFSPGDGMVLLGLKSRCSYFEEVIEALDCVLARGRESEKDLRGGLGSERTARTRRIDLQRRDLGLAWSKNTVN